MDVITFQVNPIVLTAVDNFEKLVSARRATSPQRSSADTYHDDKDIDATVKYVEASTKNRTKKPKKI